MAARLAPPQDGARRPARPARPRAGSMPWGRSQARAGAGASRPRGADPALGAARETPARDSHGPARAERPTGRPPPSRPRAGRGGLARRGERRLVAPPPGRDADHRRRVGRAARPRGARAGPPRPGAGSAPSGAGGATSTPAPRGDRGRRAGRRPRAPRGRALPRSAPAGGMPARRAPPRRRRSIRFPPAGGSRSCSPNGRGSAASSTPSPFTYTRSTSIRRARWRSPGAPRASRRKTPGRSRPPRPSTTSRCCCSRRCSTTSARARRGDHSETGAVIAERVARRLRLDAERSRRLIAAVRHHLLLPTIAIRRDIADPRVIAEVARAVSDARTLHLLYVLSVADARATGPEAWGRWKAQLMRLLYHRALARIETARCGRGCDRDEGGLAQARRDHSELVAALEGAPDRGGRASPHRRAAGALRAHDPRRPK